MVLVRITLPHCGLGYWKALSINGTSFSAIGRHPLTQHDSTLCNLCCITEPATGPAMKPGEGTS
jgi:hypothetical protein